MDLLEFIWPAWAYEPAGAPLHAAYELKQWYIQKYNDPVVQWSPETAAGHDSWMGLFLYLEFAFLLPTVLYGVYRLAVQRRGTSGCDELLFLVYALEVAFTTLVCIYDTFYWDNAVYSAELKRELQVQLYGPWFVIRKCLSKDPVGHRLTMNQRLSALSTWRPGSWAASRPPMPSRESESRSRVRAREAEERREGILRQLVRFVRATFAFDSKACICTLSPSKLQNAVVSFVGTPFRIPKQITST
jgi:hypothetical protein